ncbi:MAG: SPFH domain-containing protein [Bacteroidales bacterium]|nr:SPFH domain-containing protein [Bacteroidales bacterium]
METKEYNKQLGGKNNGFLHLFIYFLLMAALIFGMVANATYGRTGAVAIICVLLCLVGVIYPIGFFINKPNMSRVLTFFGKYNGTVRENGFFWMNPFYAKKRVSLRARNMNVPPIKVNDLNGSPIMIGLVLVWKITDTYKVSFDIDVDDVSIPEGQEKEAKASKTLNGYDNFVSVQSDAALRKVAGQYAYDNISHKEEITLRSGGDEINEKLEQELRHRLTIAGIEIVEARINYLAYAAEIASVMLRRQQADAIISAREKIVEGAVSMVDMALKKLDDEHIVALDDEKKAAMVSNLLVVLCADESASPVINTGTIYQ